MEGFPPPSQMAFFYIEEFNNWKNEKKFNKDKDLLFKKAKG